LKVGFKAPIKCCWVNGAAGLGQVWLFPGRGSGHLGTKKELRTIDRLAEEAGIQEVSRRQKLSRRKVTSHILRHSHVVNALMAGVPAPMIQKPGGAHEY